MSTNDVMDVRYVPPLFETLLEGPTTQHLLIQRYVNYTTIESLFMSFLHRLPAGALEGNYFPRDAVWRVFMRKEIPEADMWLNHV